MDELKYIIQQVQNKESGYSARIKINSNFLNLKRDLDKRPTKEELEKATINFKGYYPTLEELLSSYPQSETKKDWFANVGTPYPGTIWKVKQDKGAWINTGEPGIPGDLLNSALSRVQLASGIGLIVFTDAEDNILGYIDANGEWNIMLKDLPQYVIKNLKTLVKYINEQDSIFISAETDAEGNLISYTDTKGVKHIESLSVNKLKVKSVEGSNLGQTNTAITKSTEVALQLPQCARLDLTGVLPTDVSTARIPTVMHASLSVDNNKVLNFYASTSIQGDSSAAHPKKGFNIDMMNEAMEELSVKFGDWYEGDSFHLKAFWTDELMTRDVAGGRLWRQIKNTRSFEESYISPLNLDYDAGNDIYGTNAKFYTEGFPVSIYVNNEYHGEYIWRMKKNRKNYRLVKDNKKHIQLEAIGNSWLDGFDPKKWEMRNPKIKGYVAGGEISDPEVLADINRFFDWVKDCKNGIQDFKTTHQDYIVLNNEIDYFIFNELLQNYDGISKNYLLTFYEGRIAQTIPYDLDFTCGTRWAIPPNLKLDKLVYKSDANLRNEMMNLIMSNYNAKIKERYTELVDLGIIDINNIMNIYLAIPNIIGPEALKKNFKKWGSFIYNNFGVRCDAAYLYTFFMNRIAYLNSQFYNN